MDLHVGTRTPDRYRVNFEVNNLKPFPYLAFPHLRSLKTPAKGSSFDGELMASGLSFPTSLAVQDCWCNCVGIVSDPKKKIRPQKAHCSFAYSALASFRMGMSGSASFQRVRKSL
jgi:hypothetical protein